MTTRSIKLRFEELFRLLSITVIFALVLAACTPAATPTAAPATSAPVQPTAAPAQPTAAPPEPTATEVKIDKVTVRLSWRWKAEFAALVLTQDKGFFKEQNLDVELFEGKGSGDVLPLIANKSNTFGYLNLTTATIGIGKDMPLKIVAVLMAKNPSALAFFEDRNIKEPKDLEGKSIAMAPGEAFTVIFPAFAQKWGIDPNKVKQVQMDPNAKNQAFLEGKVDILPVYINNELPQIRALTDKKIDILMPADWGFNTVANGIVVHQDTIKENPDLVRRFVAAVSKGYAYAIQHPDEAVDAVIKRSEELASQPREVLAEQVKATLDLVYSKNTQGKPPGWMSDADWNNTLDILAETGATPTRLKNEDVYTDEFAPTQ